MTLDAHETALVERISALAKLNAAGRVTGVTGPVIRAGGLSVSVGQQVDIWTTPERGPIPAEAIGIDGDTTLLMALHELEGVGTGCEITTRFGDAMVSMGDALLGRVVDGLGRPLDGKPLPPLPYRRSLRGDPPQPLKRARITKALSTGVRVIDSMVTMGQGQRMGIFAGAGVGKSTLLSMLALHGEFDVCVVGLVGERGREVREFVEDAVTDANRDRTCVVAVTGDQAPLTRIRGAMLATSIAEHFRSQGRNVVLLLDSLTRFAMALREVGLAGGELPATKGYPPSVFVELARLLERAGNDESGSITGIYTVLVEGDDMSDPVADSTRALLDGHVVLSRNMANRGIFPAIDVLESKSRLIDQVLTKDEIAVTRKTTATLAAYRQAEDLIRIGAYQAGSDPNVDAAIKFLPDFERYVTQEQEEKTSFEDSKAALMGLVKKWKR